LFLDFETSSILFLDAPEMQPESGKHTPFSPAMYGSHVFLSHTHGHFRQLEILHFDYNTIFLFCAKNKSFSKNILCTMYGLLPGLRAPSALC